MKDVCVLNYRGRKRGCMHSSCFFGDESLPFAYTAQKLSEVQYIHTNLEADPDSVREEFSAFLVTLLTSWQDKQDKEEQGIISAQH